jgi:hypothetical protein
MKSFYDLWNLIENEDIHPFEKWHKEYMSIHNNDLQALRNSRIGVAQNVNKSSEMLKKLEKDYTRVVLIAEVDNYTSGTHGSNETPADNPFIGARVDIKINNEVALFLRGRTGFILNDSGGSFHERWGRLDAYVIVDEIMNDIQNSDLDIDYGTLYKTEYRKIKRFFKFESLQQVVGIMREMEPHLPNPVQGDESSEEYWGRLMKKAEIKNKRNDERDDWFK